MRLTWQHAKVLSMESQSPFAASFCTLLYSASVMARYTVSMLIGMIMLSGLNYLGQSFFEFLPGWENT